jgi:Protein of unknown function (DUF3011)
MDVNCIEFIATVFISVGLFLGLHVKKAQADEYRVRCESKNNKYNYCQVKTRGGVSLDRRLNDTPCIQGRTWGYDKNGIWVSGGCRADFSVYIWKGGG